MERAYKLQQNLIALVTFINNKWTYIHFHWDVSRCSRKSFHKWSIFQKVQINLRYRLLGSFCFQRFHILDRNHDKYLNMDENQLLCLLWTLNMSKLNLTTTKYGTIYIIVNVCFHQKSNICSDFLFQVCPGSSYSIICMGCSTS